MKKRFPLLLCLFIATIFNFSESIFAQNLLNSRKSSYYTYIFKITNKDAKKIYKKSVKKVDDTYFHTLVDSFPTDSIYDKMLDNGHYLQTYASEGVQKVAISTVQNFNVYVLNNSTDLCIQVFDLTGNLIKDADVRIRYKKLSFNKKTQSYIDRKSNQKGLLKVTHNGITTFISLDRKYNNSGLKRGTSKLLYRTPINYIWRPVRYIGSLPVDGVKSIARGWPQGSIRRTRNFFGRLFDGYDRYSFRRKHKGYLVFNKPKYMPGDTVKFKAFVVNRKRKPVDFPVHAVLLHHPTNINLGKIECLRKGAYHHQFVLEDSFELSLDQNYTIELLKNKKILISKSFQYEDYELKGNKLELRLNKEEYFAGDSIKLHAKGTDENELNLLDATLEVSVTPGSIEKCFDKLVFVPDELYLMHKKLDPVDETEIIIPDSIFPKANLSCEINVRMLNSDNEVIDEQKSLKYFHHKKSFQMELKGDSLYFTYEENGASKAKAVTIDAIDHFENKKPVFNGELPCTVKYSPYFSSYQITSGSLTNTFEISKEPSLIQCVSNRSHDSIFIHIQNPRNIPFKYNIYKTNKLITEGYSQNMQFKKRSNTKDNYFVTLSYLWGGEVSDVNYRIPFMDKKLNIKVNQPKLVYPGQKAKIELKITDAQNHPVKDVDITAYSMTKKFDYTPPRVPYLGKYRKNKALINNFSLNKPKHGQESLTLNYEFWKGFAGLDSIEYYNFLYPGDELYRFEYQAKDKKTQFAPFVVSHGILQSVHVVYVDNKPVYFSWSTNPRPYSFKVDSGYHTIKLRTSNKVIEFKKIYFPQGKKLILCIDQDKTIKHHRSYDKKPLLSKYEKQNLYPYNFPFLNNFGHKPAFLINNLNEFHVLNLPGYYQKRALAGPISGYYQFNLMDDYSTNFMHEPFYEYDFKPNLLKMREKNLSHYPTNLNVYESSHKLDDVLFSKAYVDRIWKEHIEKIRYTSVRYRYPRKTAADHGSLELELDELNFVGKQTPLNILVFRYDDQNFLRVYPGHVSKIHDLSQGYHKLLFFYRENKYHVEDSVLICTKGTNHLHIKQAGLLQKDSFSIEVNKLITETLFSPPGDKFSVRQELNQIHSAYRKQFNNQCDGPSISGFVYDASTREPIVGATIVRIEKPSNRFLDGTISDFDGYYCLSVSSAENLIKCTFIGYKSVSKKIGINDSYDFYLESDNKQLSEVHVVATGYQRDGLSRFVQRDMTSSAVTVDMSNMESVAAFSAEEALQGQIAGVDIIMSSGDPGAISEIKMRGVTTKFDDTPLYVVNGKMYMGDITKIKPEDIQSIEVLKGEKATALYGTKAANGVVIIQTKDGMLNAHEESKGADYDAAFMDAASEASSIRNNFSDYAFWEPSLTTDKNGKVSFDVTFPDDVTSWETFFLAMDGKRHSGQTQELIKSYKPLMARLALPRFLVESDTSFAIGKTLNYTPKPVKLRTHFELDGKQVMSSTELCEHSLLDTLPVTTNKDSVSVKYYLENEEGYMDGELRTIPVFRKGLEETDGEFYVLDTDTSIWLSEDSIVGTSTLYARAGMTDLIEDEIEHVLQYKYSCNEQLASKLKVLLAQKKISKAKRLKFSQDLEVRKLIIKLSKNKIKDGLWGWWKNSSENLWISQHVLEALTEAKNSGYRISINTNQIKDHLLWKVMYEKGFNEKVRVLNMLDLLSDNNAHSGYIYDLERNNKHGINGLFHILELKQKFRLPYNLDTIFHYQQETMTGNLYFDGEQEKGRYDLLNNPIQNTLIAYRLLQSESGKYKNELRKIRNYLIEERRRGYWTNTYESAQIIETILEDLYDGKQEIQNPVLTIHTNNDEGITKFPFEKKIDNDQSIKISKTGDMPVYLTKYRQYWNSNPSKKAEDFEIETFLGNDTLSILNAGEEVKLKVNVKLQKDAEFVMINVPIPAGCSYADKRSYHGHETHREYFKNETTIFCERLKEGEYTFTIELIPRYTGRYNWNPAKAELMYFPTFYGNNEGKKIIIKQ